MSGKTKILVLHMKELIYTGIFIFLGIIFLILLAVMFLPGSRDTSSQSGTETATETSENTTSEMSNITYTPGIYSADIEVSGNSIELQVIVEKDGISDVSFTHLDEAIETMYPLFTPVLDNIASQLRNGISLENITYEDSQKYTTLVLIEAISEVLTLATLQ